MTEYKRIGVDTSKAVFTLHGIDQQDRPVLRINLRRAQMISFFRKLPSTIIVTGRKSGAEMARLYNISQPTVSRIVAHHRSAI
jgi:hypothetical protein